MFALISIALVVVLSLYFSIKTETTEKTTKSHIVKQQALINAQEKQNRLVESLLLEVTTNSIEEIALFGGYSRDSVPELHKGKVPYWIYEGNVVYVPTKEFMTEMLKKDIEQRLFARLKTAYLELNNEDIQFSFGIPEIEVVLYNTSVKVRLDLKISTAWEDSRGSFNIKFEKNLPLRLLYLRNMAYAYVKNYLKERRIEGALWNGLKNDHRVYEPPGRMMHTISCKNPPYKSLYDMAIPVRENCLMSAAIEERNAQKFMSGETKVAVDFTVAMEDITFSMEADNGEYGYDLERIYLVPVQTPPFNPQYDTCMSFYRVSFDIRFPILVQLTDLLPSSKILYSTMGTSTTKPLIFQFYIHSYFGSNEDGSVNIFAKNTELEIPDLVESPCQGICSIDLTIPDVEKGKAWIDNCEFEFTNAHLSASSIACGRHQLIVSSDEPPGRADVMKAIEIQDVFRDNIYLPSFASLKGQVLMKNNKYCLQSHQIVIKPPEPLKYVPGSPPRFAEVILRPVFGKNEDTRRSRVNEYGMYQFEKLNPGKYILVALPSRDDSGVLAYKVFAEGTVLELSSGKNMYDLEMMPLNVEFIEGSYEAVSEVDTEC